MKRHILTLLAGGVALGARAVPAKPGLLTYTQPDGTQVKVRLVGDEHHHFYLSEDGYLLDTKDNVFYYADADNEGRITRSEFRLTDSPASKAGMQAYLSGIDREAIRSKMTVAKTEALAVREAERKALNIDYGNLATRSNDGEGSPVMRGPGLFPNASYPVFGKQTGLVILVEYQDVPFTIDNPLDYFSRMLHEEGFSDYGGTGCAREYFLENSNGQFDPEFDVFGPVTLPKDRSYYGANRPGTGGGNDKNAAQMIIDACQAIDDEVDFSKYDCDGDGWIDNVFVFYAGMGEASGGPEESIWPHSWNVYAGGGKNVRLDGVRLDRYACSNEWENIQGGRPDGVGTFIHEFSHVMGLPDLYATTYTGAQTPGEWSVLDSGPYNNNGCTPPLYSAFERYALGWLEPTDMRVAASATLPPISSNMAGIFNCYRTSGTSNPNEFYLFENRQQTGWDASLPYHGMLVWHIDYKNTPWNNNTVNNDPDHQYVDLVEAATGTMVHNRKYDPFPGARRKKQFTDDTNPSAKSWLNTPSNCPVTNIQEVDGIITFDINGGAEDPEAPVALAATDVKADSFRANWESEEGQTYWLSVYTYSDTENEDGEKERVYLPGYEMLSVGDASFLTVGDLEPEPGQTYYYVVYAGNAWQKSVPSAEVNVSDPNSSVADIAAASVRWNVIGNTLSLSGLAPAAEVTVADITGKVIAHVAADDEGMATAILAGSGIYLVKTPAGVVKIRI